MPGARPPGGAREHQPRQRQQEQQQQSRSREGAPAPLHAGCPPARGSGSALPRLLVRRPTPGLPRGPARARRRRANGIPGFRHAAARRGGTPGGGACRGEVFKAPPPQPSPFGFFFFKKRGGNKMVSEGEKELEPNIY